MPNYNENTVTGAKWTRCKDIHIRNAYLGQPHIIFGEEDIISVEGNAPIHLAKQQEIHADFDQEAGVIPLINPASGELTGSSISHIELYTILYSLYIQKALLRDAQVPIVI